MNILKELRLNRAEQTLEQKYITMFFMKTEPTTYILKVIVQQFGIVFL